LTEEITRRKPEMTVVDGDPTWRVCLNAAQAQAVVVVATEAEPAAQAAACAPENLRDKVLSHIGQLVANATEPVHMAAAAWNVIQTFGSEVQDSQWMGAGTFKELLMAAEGHGFDVATGGDGTSYLFDPARHTLPVRDYFAEKWKEHPEELDAFARRVNRVTGTPLLTPDGYGLVFGSLQEELRDNDYFLTATSRAVRERCIERGSPVPRKAINFILQGITYAGHRFKENPLSDTAEIFAGVFKDNVLKLCKGAQLVLSEDELELLSQWIHA